MRLSRARQLQLLQHEISSAALTGAGVDEIDRSVIAPSRCCEEDKAALRLYAFSFLPRFDQRRIALNRLWAAERGGVGSARVRRGVDVHRQRPEPLGQRGGRRLDPA